MKFMEKAKRFFTLSAKHEGFTLVELIVVIAILAILAGVAIPAYSGYIKKANEAADQTLLSAVNRAFASAAFENGVDAVTKPDGSFSITLSDGKVDAVSHYEEQFDSYYAGNQDLAFKTITALYFQGGVFVDAAKLGTVTVDYKGSTIAISNATLQALKGSTFGQNMGPDALLNQIGTVTAAADIMAGKLDAVFTDPSFTEFAMSAMGVTTETEYEEAIDNLINQVMDEKGLSYNDAAAQVQANAAVLYASQNAVNYTQDDIDALFTKGNANTVKDNLKGTDAADGMAQAALVYGMYTAYANSDQYGSDELKEKANNPLTVLNALDNDDDFLAYVNSEQGKTDMAALQGSLGVIVDSTENNASTTTDLMVNGFNNDELKDIMSGLMS